MVDSIFKGFDLFVLIDLGMTTHPKCSICNFIIVIYFVPGPPLLVAINAILLLKASRQYFVVVEIPAIALFTIGGVEPLYSGAQIMIP